MDAYHRIFFSNSFFMLMEQLMRYESADILLMFLNFFNPSWIMLKIRKGLLNYFISSHYADHCCQLP